MRVRRIGTTEYVPIRVVLGVVAVGQRSVQVLHARVLNHNRLLVLRSVTYVQALQVVVHLGRYRRTRRIVRVLTRNVVHHRPVAERSAQVDAKSFDRLQGSFHFQTAVLRIHAGQVNRIFRAVRQVDEEAVSTVQPQGVVVARAQGQFAVGSTPVQASFVRVKGLVVRKRLLVNLTRSVVDRLVKRRGSLHPTQVGECVYVVVDRVLRATLDLHAREVLVLSVVLFAVAVVTEVVGQGVRSHCETSHTISGQAISAVVALNVCTCPVDGCGVVVSDFVAQARLEVGSTEVAAVVYVVGTAQQVTHFTSVLHLCGTHVQTVGQVQVVVHFVVQLRNGTQGPLVVDRVTQDAGRSGAAIGSVSVLRNFSIPVTRKAQSRRALY